MRKILETDKIKTTVWIREGAFGLIARYASETDSTKSRYVQDLVMRDHARRSGHRTAIGGHSAFASTGTHTWEDMRAVDTDAEVLITYGFKRSVQEWRVEMHSETIDVYSLLEAAGAVDIEGDDNTVKCVMPNLPFG